LKAVVYEQFGGALQINNVADPVPESHGVVIEVKSTGLCLSDWHGWMGHDKDIVLPHVPGHELAGIITAVGKEVKNFQVGERVTVPFVGGCGSCEECSTGNHQICRNQFQPGFTHWGSFAEYVSIHFADVNLVHLPEEVSFETAASLGCRFATAFRAIVDQGQVSGGQWVAVHGCGGVGLSAIMIAKALGAQVIAVDINDESLKMANELGASYAINAIDHKNISEEVIAISKGGVHVSLDALGAQETLFNSISNLKRRGKHIQVGIMQPHEVHAKIPVDLIISKELEILGSHGMQAFRYRPMLEMIKNSVLEPEQLVKERISLKESVNYLPQMKNDNSPGIKVINQF